MNKKIGSILIIGLLCLSAVALTIPQVNAQSSVVVAQVQDGSTNWFRLCYLYTNNASASAGYYAGVSTQAFTMSGNYYLQTANFMVKKVGSPSGYCQAALINPATGAIIELSTDILFIESVADTFVEINWEFSGTTLLANGQSYYVALILTETTGTIDTSNYLGINGPSTSNAYMLISSGWNLETGHPNYKIYGSTTATPTTTPTPPPATPTPTPTLDYKWDENANQWYFWNGTHWIISNGPAPTANAQISAFTTDFISIIFPLILLFGLACVGAYFAGSFGFLGGLTIGAILGYTWLSLSLWVLLLVILVDVVALFSGKMGELHIRGRE